MKYLIGLLGFLMAVQIGYDVMTFDSTIHGEVAWRWLTNQGTAFRNSADSYPGYYCGQHDCRLKDLSGIQPLEHHHSTAGEDQC